MNKQVTVSVIGGDTRQIYMAKRLKEDGYDVSLYGFGLSEKAAILPQETCLQKALSADVLILPLPYTRNNKTLNAAFSYEDILLTDIIRELHENQQVFIGKGGEQYIRQILSTGADCTDYFENEELTLGNALLTAEGILSLVLENTDITVFGMKAAVIGYGRVGYFTAKDLHALGADVTVYARNPVQRTKVTLSGMKSADICELKDNAERYDCIINTVPSQIIGKDILRLTDRSCLLIESASYPYGFDFNAASELDRKIIKAFSLPGKIAAETAGIIIADALKKMIREV